MSDKKEHRAVRVVWKLLVELWCVPEDQTEAENKAMAREIRDGLGDTFAGCPLEYIEDRLFGGLGCDEDKGRRHVMFNTMAYSFMAAEEGRYWANDGRREKWQSLAEENAGQWIGGGPFTDDRPS